MLVKFCTLQAKILAWHCIYSMHMIVALALPIYTPPACVTVEVIVHALHGIKRADSCRQILTDLQRQCRRAVK